MNKQIKKIKQCLDYSLSGSLLLRDAKFWCLEYNNEGSESFQKVHSIL